MGEEEPRGKFGELGKEEDWCWRRAARRINRAVSESAAGRYFKLESRKSSFTTELRAGTTTFLTMAYIISVNSSILTSSGGPCSVSDCTPSVTGPDCKSLSNPGYLRCLQELKSDLVVATIVPAIVGSLAMGCFANLPLALAPAMGTNAYFTFNMVGLHGSGPMSYGTALAVVMLEGCIFLFLSVVGLRARLARLIPRSIRLACAAGIGLFLAFTGLQSQQGVGLVGPSPATLVAISDGAMRSPTLWLGAAGFLVSSFGLMKGVKGSMIYGIVLVTMVSWIRGTSVSVFPDTDAGNASYKSFKRVVGFHTIKKTAGAISFKDFNRSEVWVALATLLYVDVLDTTGSMYSMAEYGGFTTTGGGGGFEGEYRAFMVDAGTTILSTAVGLTTVTAFVESTSGMRDGGKTGITAIVVAAYFAAALMLTPVLTSVPAAGESSSPAAIHHEV